MECEKEEEAWKREQERSKQQTKLIQLIAITIPINFSRQMNNKPFRIQITPTTPETVQFAVA